MGGVVIGVLRGIVAWTSAAFKRVRARPETKCELFREKLLQIRKLRRLESERPRDTCRIVTIVTDLGKCDGQSKHDPSQCERCWEVIQGEISEYSGA